MVREIILLHQFLNVHIWRNRHSFSADFRDRFHGSSLEWNFGYWERAEGVGNYLFGEQERMKMSETTDTQIQTYLSSISDSYIYEEAWLS